MELSDEDVDRALPIGSPPSRLVDPILDRLLTDTADPTLALSESMRRSMLWSAALQAVFEQSGLWIQVPGYDFVTYGFTRDETGSLSFGVIIHVSFGPVDLSRRRRRSNLRQVERLEFELLRSFRRRGIVDTFNFQIAVLRVGEEVFPVHVTNGRRGDDQARYSPIHPSYGTAACGVRLEDSGGNEDQLHLLTCAHVVAETDAGGEIPLTLGQVFDQHCSGVISRIGPPRVDAATILPSTQILAQLDVDARIQCMPLVPPGLRVSFRGQASGIIETIVTDVANPRLMAYRNFFHVEFLLFIAHSGRHGDSGALVINRDGIGDAVGLYLGEATAVDDTMIGRCQLMAQVKHCLQIAELVDVTCMGESYDVV